jgi:Phytanoyl-CoA dioxygenase (PhyH)
MTIQSVDQQQEVYQGLDEDGYCVIPDVVSKDRLTEFNQRIIAAYRRSKKFHGGGSISGHLNCFPGEISKFIYDEMRGHGICDAVHAACPGLTATVRPTLNLNLPGSSAQHYHMDGVYTQEYIICNVAVVDTDLVNGAIDLLPSTHKEFYPFWRYAVTRKYRLSRRVPMSQGDVLLRRSTLWHRGMPNKSQEPRPMFSLTIGEAPIGVEDPFLAGGGGIEFYANWYSTGILGSIRERVEVAAPVTRSTVRFAKSLVGNRGYSSY